MKAEEVATGRQLQQGDARISGAESALQLAQDLVEPELFGHLQGWIELVDDEVDVDLAAWKMCISRS